MLADAASQIAILSTCDIYGGDFVCQAADGLETIRLQYPSAQIDYDGGVDGPTCEAWLQANASAYDIVIFVGYIFSDCLASSTLYTDYPSTWFANIDVNCDGPAENLVCVSFDETEVAFSAGYLAGLHTSTQTVGWVGGIPTSAVKRLANGYRMGVAESCPDCYVEGVFAHSYVAERMGEQIAGHLKNRSVDVLFNAAGGTGSAAILHAAGLNMSVIGVDVDEYNTLLAGLDNATVRAKMLTSAIKGVAESVIIAISLFLDVEVGSSIPEVSDGQLVLDYSTGAIALASCHEACGSIGTANWQAVKKMELALASGIQSASTETGTGNMIWPALDSDNVFEEVPQAARSPSGRAQHSTASFKTAWLEEVFVFGGIGEEGSLDDAWIYHISLGSWYELVGPMVVGEPPPALTKSCAVGFDYVGVLVFGGRDANVDQRSEAYFLSIPPAVLGFTDPTSELLRFTWTRLTNIGDSAPAVEAPGCAALNASCAIVFGGRSQLKQSSETYVACLEDGDMLRWTLLETSGTSPAAREGAAVAVIDPTVVLGAEYTSTDQAVVLVGGKADDECTQDVWLLPLTSSDLAWRRLASLPGELCATPGVFTAPPKEGLADVLVVQHGEESSSGMEVGIGAYTFDADDSQWLSQSGAIAADFEVAGDPNDPSLMFSSTTPEAWSKFSVIRFDNRTYFLGGVRGSDYVSEFRVGSFALQKECPAGQWARGVSCEDCPAGYYSSGGVSATCQACSAGRFAAQPGSTACSNCEAGTYSSDTAVNCTACPAGSSTLGSGSSSGCSLCARGSFSEEGWENCQPCSTGSFAQGTGFSECTLCQGQLLTEYPGAYSEEQCLCLEGTYRPMAVGSDNATCKLCPEGLICRTGSSMDSYEEAREDGFPEDYAGVFPLVSSGYYSEVDNPLSVFVCLPQAACVGGLPGHCGRGYTGLTCITCPNGQAAGEESCTACSKVDAAILFAAMILTYFVVGTGCHILVNQELAKSAQGFLIARTLFAMALHMVFTLSVLTSIRVSWPSPLEEFATAVQSLQVDLDVFHLACLLENNNFVAMYASQFLVCISSVLVVVAGSFTLHCIPATRRYAKFTAGFICNSIGVLLQSFFVPLGLLSFHGLRCMSNPNGKSTLIANTSVICWEGTDHTAIVTISIIAVLFIPVNFLALTAMVTYKYQALSARFGAHFTRSVRFLTIRMRPQYIWLSFLLNLRNFAVPFFATVFSDGLSAKVLLLQSIFVLWLVSQCYTSCWRFFSLNLTDSLLTTITVILITTLGLVAAVYEGEKNQAQSLGWTFVLLTCCALAFTVFTACRHLVIATARSKQYGVFITHHKASAGVQARQLKLILETSRSCPVFLDVDALDNLDNLSFAVKSSRRLLVLVTDMVFTRPWCAVEIASAWRNNVPITLGSFKDDFVSQTGPGLVGVRLSTGAFSEQEEEAIFAKSDFLLDTLAEAYQHVNTLPIIPIPLRKPTPDTIMIFARTLLGPDFTYWRPFTPVDDDTNKVCIVYDDEDDEAASVAQIAGHLLRRRYWSLQMSPALEDGGLEAFEEAKHTGLVLVSKDLCSNPHAVAAITTMVRANVGMVTFTSSQGFCRPSPDFFAAVRSECAFSKAQLSVIESFAPGCQCDKIAQSLEQVYQVLAFSFSPEQNEKLMEEQFNVIEHRLVRAGRGNGTDGSATPTTPSKMFSWRKLRSFNSEIRHGDSSPRGSLKSMKAASSSPPVPVVPPSVGTNNWLEEMTTEEPELSVAFDDVVGIMGREAV